MRTTHTIELSTSEILTLQKALSIIDDIAATANTSVDNVFEYLCEVAEIDDTREYHIKPVHDINKIK